MTNSWIKYAAAALLLMTACSSSSVKRDVANTPQAAPIRAGVYNLDDNHKLVVLGIDQTGREFNGMDLTKLDGGQSGFVSADGQDISNVNPMFLIELTNNGVNRVYDFNWDGGFGTSRKFPGLPPRLMSVPGARAGLWGEAIADTVLTGLRFTPVALVSALIDQGRNRHKRKNYYEATYLSNMLEQANNGLTDDSDKALGVLTKRQVEDTLAALHLRYNESRPYAGLLSKKSDRHDDYMRYFAQRDKQVQQNAGLLREMGDELGLRIEPISPEFMFVMADTNSHFDPDKLEKNLIGIDSEGVKQYCAQFIDKGGLCPIGVLSMINNKGPQLLSQGGEPGAQGDKINRSRFLQAAMDIGLTFVSDMYINVAIRAGDKIVRFVERKSGNLMLETTVTSYAQLKAVLDTNILQLSPAGQAVDAGVVQASLTDIEQIPRYQSDKDFHDKIEEYKKKFTDEVALAQEDLAKIWRFTLSAMADEEYRRGELFGADNAQSKLQDLKHKHWSRLSRVLKDGDEKQLLVDAIDGKTDQPSYDEGGQRRNPYAEYSTPNNHAAVAQTNTKGRNPAQVGDALVSNPVIIFMVDGLRVDRFKDAAKRGFLPNLKALFLDKGAEVESYTSRSLTLPSWATILSGFDQDETGVRGNSQAARTETGTIENYLDWRKDVTLPQYVASGRSYRSLQRSGIQWLPRQYNREEVLLGFAPLNDGNYPPVADLIEAEMKHLDQALEDILPGYALFDEATSTSIARSIKQNPGKQRFVMVWLTSIDEASHYNNDSIVNGDAYKNIDKAVARVMAAANADPVLRDAQLFLISDHGHRGGYEVGKFPQDGSIFPPKTLNSSFNLTKYFAGDYDSAPTYHFRVGAAESPNPNFDLSYLREFLIQPFSYTYVGKRGTKSEGRSILVDDSGASMAQVFVRGPSGKWNTDPMNYYQLTHFSSEAVEGQKDLAGDLFGMVLKNLATYDPTIRKQILDASEGGHPVKFFTCSLPDAATLASADTIAEGLSASNRAPVLVRDGHNRVGLIFTRTNSIGTEEYRYLVMKNFAQDANGKISGAISQDPNDDPLGYLGKVTPADGTLDSNWRSDRTWLALAKNTDFPTAVFSMVKSQTLSPRLQGIVAERQEVPDFIVYANRGFAFHGSDYQESDHGGLYPEEVKNSFFISGMGTHKPNLATKIDGETLNRDFTATVLEASGKTMKANMTNGKSVFSRYMQATAGRVVKWNKKNDKSNKNKFERTGRAHDNGNSQ